MAPRIRDFVTRNLTLKLVALVLALLLWAVVRSESPTRVTVQDVPVQVALHDPDWTLGGSPAPPTVTVVASGPVRDMVRFAVERPRIVVPVERVQDTSEVRSLDARWVRLNGGLDGIRVEDIRPTSVELFFERLDTRFVPVAPVLSGDVPPQVQLVDGAFAEPPVVRVSGPQRRVAEMDSVRLIPIDLGGITESITMGVPVDTTGLAGLVVSPLEVRVTLRVVPAPPPEEPEPLPEPELPTEEVPDTTPGEPLAAAGGARRP